MAQRPRRAPAAALRGRRRAARRRRSASARGHEARAAPARSTVRARARAQPARTCPCKIPHGKLRVVTGPSGSGKSSLAFDVVFAEGQRRFLETLTPYARQFLPTLPRPDVDRVTGVPPPIALEQRTTRAGANSTVATVTEVAHYLRLLFAKVGELHCPNCDAPIAADHRRTSSSRSSPAIARARARSTRRRCARARAPTSTSSPPRRAPASPTARVDGAARRPIDPPPSSTKTKEHDIDLVRARGQARRSSTARGVRSRARAGATGALKRARPRRSRARTRLLSTERACPRCGTGVPELDPRWFSFNTKQGHCEACEGTGVEGGARGAVAEGRRRAVPRRATASRLAPVPARVRLDGRDATTRWCRRCRRRRARARAAAGRFDGDATRSSPRPRSRARAAPRVRRAGRASATSRSTAPRARSRAARCSACASPRSSAAGLTGALYVLDEPTIGLHPRDTQRLLANLRALVDTGSTVLVVEHDAETIRAADHLIDLGPGGGRDGGHIVAEGTPADGARAIRTRRPRAALRERAQVRPPAARGEARARGSSSTGARANNLAGRRPCASRSGRHVASSPACQRLGQEHARPPGVLPGAARGARARRAEARAVRRAPRARSACQRALAVDQSPIGRTPRSVPATFLGIWDEIRKLFAGTPGGEDPRLQPRRASRSTRRRRPLHRLRGAGRHRRTRCRSCPTW